MIKGKKKLILTKNKKWISEKPKDVTQYSTMSANQKFTNFVCTDKNITIAVKKLNDNFLPFCLFRKKLRAKIAVSSN